MQYVDLSFERSNNLADSIPCILAKSYNFRRSAEITPILSGIGVIFNRDSKGFINTLTGIRMTVRHRVPA